MIMPPESAAERIDLSGEHPWLDLLQYGNEPETTPAAEFICICIIVNVEIQALYQEMIVIPIARFSNSLTFVQFTAVSAFAAK